MSSNSANAWRRHSSFPIRHSPPTIPDMQDLQPADIDSSSVPSRTLSTGPFGMRRLERRLMFEESRFVTGRNLRWNPPIDLHLLDYVSDYDTNLMCPICRSPFVDPVVLNECDHCFCRDCLRQTWNSSEYTPGIPKGNCPTCRTSSKLMGRGPVSRILINILDDLIVRCPKHEEGCKAEIKRSDVQDHANNYCDFTMVECPGPDCDLPIRRKDAKECLHFGVTCMDCRTTTHMSNLETHWHSECPDRKVTCELCQSAVFYREISRHARETCPAITIPCTGASYGCSFRSKRGAINQHTKQCVFAALVPFIEGQVKRVTEVEEQQKLMARKVEILEGGFDNLSKVLQSSESVLASSHRSSHHNLANDPSIQIPTPPPHPPDLEPSPSVYYDPPVSPSDFHTSTSWPLPDNGPAHNLPSSATSQQFPPVPPPGSSSTTAHIAAAAAAAADQPSAITPYTHLLGLHESLRDELARVSTALHDLDGRHSMLILNENLRLREELAYLGGQVGGLGRQVGWLTSARLQGQGGGAMGVGRGVAAGGSSRPAVEEGEASASAGAAAVGGTRMGRRLTDEGRTKL